MGKSIELQFTYHSPKGDQPERYERLREMAKALAYGIDDCCPHSREKDIAMERLKESVMWANASIAMNE